MRGRVFGTFDIVSLLLFYCYYLFSHCASCLTGLPIMGAILSRQSGVDFAGLTIFAAVAALLGASLLVCSTYLVSKSYGIWKV